jgi:hypothetical protein
MAGPSRWCSVVLLVSSVNSVLLSLMIHAKPSKKSGEHSFAVGNTATSSCRIGKLRLDDNKDTERN